MKNKTLEIEQLRIENEMLKIQLQAAENNSMCLLRASASDMASKIILIKTIKIQQEFLRKIVFKNAGHLGLNDFVRNAYHLLYQN